MILDIDIGNTRIKWILSREGDMVERGAIEEDALESLFTQLSKGDFNIARIRVASVRPSLHETLETLSYRYCRQLPEYAVVKKQFGRLVNAYEDVSQMGVDRWLGIIAATRMCQGDCIVVSVGSAITVDLLDTHHQHKGGFIGPGLRLMRQSLYRDTDQVKLDTIDALTMLEPGDSTQQAVSNGLLLMQLGLVEKSIDMLAVDRLTILVTGGDGVQLVKHLVNSSNQPSTCEIIFEPDLVFKGLSIIL